MNGHQQFVLASKMDQRLCWFNSKPAVGRSSNKLSKRHDQKIEDILAASGPKQPYAIHAVADMEAVLQDLKTHNQASDLSQQVEQLKTIAATLPNNPWRKGQKGDKGKGKGDKGKGKGGRCRHHTAVGSPTT